MLILFKELRKHRILANRRNPMFEKNRFGKYLIYGLAIFWAFYLILLGIAIARIIVEASSNMEAYHILNQYLLIFLTIDFLLRFSIQKLPAQELKPYILLPIKRRRLVDMWLLSSVQSGIELIWLFFFIPFAFASAIFKFYGIGGVILYNLGIVILFLFNNYFYLLCRTLIQERIWWTFLPLGFFGALYAWLFLGDNSMQTIFMNLGEGYMTGKLWAFAATIALVVIMWLISRRVIDKLMYSELTKQEDTRVKRIREYHFLNRFGEVGEYMRLELKMLTRNKRTKASFRMVILVVLLFSLLLSFTSMYNAPFMANFIAIYNVVVFGMIMLSQVMAFEGNYIDGLMSRKESLLSLLKGKYYLSCLFALVPFTLTLPAVFADKMTLLQLLSYLFFGIGFIHFLLFQGAVYCNKTIPLNTNLTGRTPSSTFQYILSFAALGVPMIMFYILEGWLGKEVTFIVLTVIGAGFVLTSNLWISNIYHRFMVRRYQNMEGFRDSR